MGKVTFLLCCPWKCKPSAHRQNMKATPVPKLTLVQGPEQQLSNKQLCGHLKRGSLKACSVMLPFNCISKIVQEISAPVQAAPQDEDQCIDNETAAWQSFLL